MASDIYVPQAILAYGQSMYTKVYIDFPTCTYVYPYYHVWFFFRFLRKIGKKW
jgi:hypothetical protein